MSVFPQTIEIGKPIAPMLRLFAGETDQLSVLIHRATPQDCEKRGVL